MLLDATVGEGVTAVEYGLLFVVGHCARGCYPSCELGVRFESPNFMIVFVL